MKIKRFANYAVMTFVIIGIIFTNISSMYPLKTKVFANAFDTQHALDLLAPMAKTPHAAGMKSNEALRRYITDQITQMGLAWEIQETTAYSDSFNSFGSVKNIIATIPGESSDSAVAIAAHYDSVIWGPGASDDTMNVAAMLEVMNTLKDEGPFKNDIVFVITDAEENGLNGMIAFMAQHPLAESIDFLINFEARGTAGASLMFETTPGNNETIKTFSRATSHIMSNSFMSDIYNMLDYDTDFTVFKENGVQGLNFANIAEGHNYHSDGDNYDQISLSSLSRQGIHMLELSRYYGNYDLSGLYEKDRTDRVFFDIFGIFFVHYSTALALAFKFLSIGLGMFGLALTFKRKKASLKETSLILVLQLILAGVLVGLFPLLQKIFILFGQETYIKLNTTNYNSVPLFFSLLLLYALILIVFYYFIDKKIKLQAIVSANVIGWVALSITTMFIMKGASYLTDIILLGITIFDVLLCLNLDNEKDSSKLLVFHFIPFIIANILMLPVILIVSDAFFLRGFNITTLIVSLLLTVWIPKLISYRKNIVPLLFILLIGIILLTVVEEKTNDLFIDEVSQELYSTEKTQLLYEDFTNSYGAIKIQWHVNGTNTSNYQSLQKQTFREDIPVHSVTLLSDVSDRQAKTRTIQLQIDAPLPSSHLFVYIDNANKQINQVLINDLYEVDLKHVNSDYDDYIQLEGFGLEEGQFKVTISTSATKLLEPITAAIGCRSSYLKELEGYGIYDTLISLDPGALENSYIEIFEQVMYDYY